MADIDDFKKAFYALPLNERVRVFDEMELSLLKELEERALREDLAIVEKRLADLDAGITTAVPWEEVRRDLFRHT